MVRDNRTQIIFSVDILDARLDIVLVVDAEHQPRLIEARLVVARDLDLDLEFAPAKGVEIGRVIDRKAVM